MTTTTKRRWPLAEARTIADRLYGLLAPACNRIVIAGSIRRLVPTVGDVELLVIPRITLHPTDLFSPSEVLDYLDEKVKYLVRRGALSYRLNSRGGRTYGPLDKLLVDTATGMNLDIFSTTARNWGMTMMVRTGPATYCQKFMGRLLHLGLWGHAYGGITDRDDVERDCPDEETVFHFLQWPYEPPERRQ